MEKQKRERAKKEEIQKKEVMVFRLEKQLKENYINFCIKNGISYGKRLRILLLNDLEKNKTL